MTILPTIPTSIKSLDEAVSFAIAFLQDYEIKEFLTEYLAGKDITPWIEGVKIDHMAAQGDWSAFDRLQAGLAPFGSA